MIPLTERGKLYLGLLGVGIAIGLTGGWALWRPRPVVAEPPAVSIRQPDSSLVLARRPDTVVKIVHQIPPGFAPERHVELVVQPRPPIPLVGANIKIVNSRDSAIRLPQPVRIRLTVGRLSDGSHRVIASSPDGVVIDSLSIDVPLGESAAPAGKLVHSAGVSRDLLTGAWGGIVTRDVAFARLFVAGEPRQGLHPATLKLGAMIRF